MDAEKSNIAICGLDCSTCDIFQATGNPAKAQPIVDWFKREQNVDVNIADIGCLGCRGERSKHWSPDCWILKCCVDEHRLEYCYQCDEFPCEKLIEWSKESEGYGKVLARLKEMKEI